MRWLLVLLLIGVAFGGFLALTHKRADDLVLAEEAAVKRMRELVTTKDGPASLEEGGYGFARVESGSLPPIWVAHPLEHGTDGVRWFAAAGDHVFQFDPISTRAPDNRPDVTALRRFLSLTPEERQAARLPGGWAPLD